MQPAKGFKKFKKETRYPHLRSDGLSKRSNGTNDLQGGKK